MTRPAWIVGQDIDALVAMALLAWVSSCLWSSFMHFVERQRWGRPRRCREPLWPGSMREKFLVPAQQRFALPARCLRARVVDTGSSSQSKSGGEQQVSSAPQGKPKNDQEWRFFDVAKIWVEGGDGGDGCVAFRREAHVSHGGPSGGNGGDGGSVYLECAGEANTLQLFRRKVHFRANSGRNGQGKSRHAARAKDLVIPVPPGTVVRQSKEDGGGVAAELTRPGQRIKVATGGKGGRGNESFKTNFRNAPRMRELGGKGGQRWLELELKLVADVGLVGVPNAGKSSFLRRVSNATPKVADYPFTTVVPNLGVVDVPGGEGMVVFDIPGLIEGAHRGAGLGPAFLRHVERCRVLLHLVDGSAQDPVADYRIIQDELVLHNPALAAKPQVVIVTKTDLPAVAERVDDLIESLRAATEQPHTRFMSISSFAGTNIDELVSRLSRLVSSLPAPLDQPVVDVTSGDGTSAAVDFAAIDAQGEEFDDEDRIRGVGSDIPGLVVTLGNDKDKTSRKDGKRSLHGVHASPAFPGQFILVGGKAEKLAAVTDFEYQESVDRYQRALAELGVYETLFEAGAKEGDLIMIGENDVYFEPTLVAGSRALKQARRRYLSELASSEDVIYAEEGDASAQIFRLFPRQSGESIDPSISSSPDDARADDVDWDGFDQDDFDLADLVGE